MMKKGNESSMSHCNSPRRSGRYHIPQSDVHNSSEYVGTSRRSLPGNRSEMALSQSDQVRSDPSHPHPSQRNRKNRYACCHYYFLVIHDKDTVPQKVDRVYSSSSELPSSEPDSSEDPSLSGVHPILPLMYSCPSTSTPTLKASTARSSTHG